MAAPYSSHSHGRRPARGRSGHDGRRREYQAYDYGEYGATPYGASPSLSPSPTLGGDPRQSPDHLSGGGSAQHHHPSRRYAQRNDSSGSVGSDGKPDASPYSGEATPQSRAARNTARLRSHARVVQAAGRFSSGVVVRDLDQESGFRNNTPRRHGSLGDAYVASLPPGKTLGDAQRHDPSDDGDGSGGDDDDGDDGPGARDSDGIGDGVLGDDGGRGTEPAASGHTDRTVRVGGAREQGNHLRRDSTASSGRTSDGDGGMRSRDLSGESLGHHQRDSVDGTDAAEQAYEHPLPTRLTGFLRKKGGGGSKLGRHSWKRRYFVLAGTRLAYFGKAGDPKPKGIIKLRGAALRTGRHRKYDNYFEIGVHPQPGGRIYPLVADTVEEMREWMRSISWVARFGPIPSDDNEHAYSRSTRSPSFDTRGVALAAAMGEADASGSGPGSSTPVHPADGMFGNGIDPADADDDGDGGDDFDGDGTDGEGVGGSRDGGGDSHGTGNEQGSESDGGHASTDDPDGADGGYQARHPHPTTMDAMGNGVQSQHQPPGSNGGGSQQPAPSTAVAERGIAFRPNGNNTAARSKRRIHVSKSPLNRDHSGRATPPAATTAPAAPASTVPPPPAAGAPNTQRSPRGQLPHLSERGAYNPSPLSATSSLPEMPDIGEPDISFTAFKRGGSAGDSAAGDGEVTRPATDVHQPRADDSMRGTEGSLSGAGADASTAATAATAGAVVRVGNTGGGAFSPARKGTGETIADATPAPAANRGVSTGAGAGAGAGTTAVVQQSPPVLPPSPSMPTASRRRNRGRGSPDASAARANAQLRARLAAANCAISKLHLEVGVGGPLRSSLCMHATFLTSQLCVAAGVALPCDVSSDRGLAKPMAIGVGSDSAGGNTISESTYSQ